MVAAAVALVVSNCSGDSGGQPSAQPAQAPASTTTTTTTTNAPTAAIGPFSPELVSRLTTMLTAAGVEVLTDRAAFGGSAAATGLAFSEFQVRNMAVEIASGNEGAYAVRTSTSSLLKAVELATVVVKGVVKVLTAPIAEALRVAIGVVGVASYASSMLKRWAVKVTGEAAQNRSAFDDEAAPDGRVTARIDDPGFFGFPEALNACAKLVGLTLPSQGEAQSNPLRR